MHGDPDGPALVGERAGDRLADPPGGVGRELEAAAPVELLDGAHEAERALLDQVEEGEAAAAVALGDRDDETQVGLDHLLLGGLVAELDALGEADLVGGGEQRHAADVLEEELERVGGLLDGRGGPARTLDLLRQLRGPGSRLGLLEQLDAGLLEVLVDRLDRVGVQAQPVEHLGHLFHAEEAHLLPADDQLAELAVARQTGHLLRCHPPPFPRGILERDMSSRDVRRGRRGRPHRRLGMTRGWIASRVPRTSVDGRGRAPAPHPWHSTVTGQLETMFRRGRSVKCQMPLGTRTLSVLTDGPGRGSALGVEHRGARGPARPRGPRPGRRCPPRTARCPGRTGTCPGSGPETRVGSPPDSHWAIRARWAATSPEAAGAGRGGARRSRRPGRRTLSPAARRRRAASAARSSRARGGRRAPARARARDSWAICGVEARLGLVQHRAAPGDQAAPAARGARGWPRRWPRRPRGRASGRRPGAVRRARVAPRRSTMRAIALADHLERLLGVDRGAQVARR